MIAYKLLKLRRDGSIGPLFINASARLPVGKWMDAEAHYRKGFAFRPGWHCTLKPEAPHLKERLSSGQVRQWWRVEVEDVVKYNRPESQGGTWVLAQKMKLITPGA
jgi:hypothetical protein